MSAGFTPGPWFALGKAEVVSKDDPICSMAWGPGKAARAIIAADRNLIAAAPDLYASASSILASLEGGGLGSNRQIEALRAAIAKADGE